MANYPDWVKQFRQKGTAVKKVGSSYYLYRHSSKRVPGKKYPQASDEYIGRITPEGVIQKNKKKLSIEEIHVYEYGFSKAVWQSCPETWKKPLKNDWENVLLWIIGTHSPNSYLLRDTKPVRTRRNLALQEEKLSQMLPYPLSDLEVLAGIFLICFPEREAISHVSPQHRALLERLGLLLEV